MIVLTQAPSRISPSTSFSRDMEMSNRTQSQQHPGGGEGYQDVFPSAMPAAVAYDSWTVRLANERPSHAGPSAVAEDQQRRRRRCLSGPRWSSLARATGPSAESPIGRRQNTTAAMAATKAMSRPNRAIMRTILPRVEKRGRAIRSGAEMPAKGTHGVGPVRFTTACSIFYCGMFSRERPTPR